MEYVRLGQSGLRVSQLCLGMMSFGSKEVGRPWSLEEREAEPIVRKAADAGITFFDTADAYSGGSSEEITGRVLSRVFPRREDYVLATKVFFPTGDGPNDRGLSRKHILDSIDGSLHRLGLDHVDLYQVHRWDPDTPIEETMAALHDVVRAGKARYIGASSMFAWQFAKAQHTASTNGWTRFVSMQNHYNLLYREEEREMIPLCVDQGVGIVPWSPLARGLLARPQATETASTARSASDPLIEALYPHPNPEVLAGLADVAVARDLAPAQVALAWLVHKPAVAAPIVGTTTTRHLEDAVAAAELTLSDDEIARLEAPYRPQNIIGHQ